MMIFPVIGLVIGILLGIGSEIVLPYGLTVYVAIAILACMDTLLGGVRSACEKNFQMYVFMSGFFINSFVAVALIWIGKQLYIDLSIAAIVVFGSRIFYNISQIRRFLLHKTEKMDTMEK